MDWLAIKSVHFTGFMNIDGLVKCIFLLWFNSITGDVKIRLWIIIIKLKIKLVFLEECGYL